MDFGGVSKRSFIGIHFTTLGISSSVKQAFGIKQLIKSPSVLTFLVPLPVERARAFFTVSPFRAWGPQTCSFHRKSGEFGLGTV